MFAFDTNIKRSVVGDSGEFVIADLRKIHLNEKMRPTVYGQKIYKLLTAEVRKEKHILSNCAAGAVTIKHLRLSAVKCF